LYIKELIGRWIHEVEMYGQSAGFPTTVPHRVSWLIIYRKNCSGFLNQGCLATMQYNPGHYCIST